MTLFAISLVLALVAGLFAYRLAEYKGRSARTWMTATVLFVVPLLLLLLLPARCPGSFPGPGACA